MATNNPIFNLQVPPETALHFMKMKSAYRETENICLHNAGERIVPAGYCVVDYYCNLCGEWRGDKDVS